MADPRPPLVRVLAALTPDVIAELAAAAKVRRKQLAATAAKQPAQRVGIACHLARLEAGAKALADLAWLTATKGGRADG